MVDRRGSCQGVVLFCRRPLSLLRAVPDTQIVKVAGSYEAIIQTTKGMIAVRLKRTDARETVKIL